nr:MAG TPA: hypothetical protein [Caudoviricetes sp.]
MKIAGRSSIRIFLACRSHKKTACHAAISQVTFPLHLIKRVPGFAAC